MRRWPAGAIGIVILACTAATAAPPDGDTERLLERLERRIAGVTDLEARFRQMRYTPLFRKPIESSGRVRVKGAITRWDTERPHPMVELYTTQDMRHYFPADAALEIYPLDRKLRRLSASPLPRPSDLRELFSIRAVPLTGEERGVEPGGLGLELSPTDAWLAKHIETIRLVVDPARDLVTRMEITDIDGERTVRLFERIRLNSGLDDADLALRVPPGTKIARHAAPGPP